jgi:virulence factor
MLLQQFIERYKKARKQEFLNRPSSYRCQYAFIGAGQHSFSNLYPLIHYFGVPLKMICTLHKEHADKMAARFNDCTGTGNLEDIINNKEIKGVFVSANPSQHFDIVQHLLTAGKTVFVEKPPCYSLQELTKLIAHPRSQYCMAGLQKRFSTVNELLQPYCASAIDYSYRYFTGPYPEGDAAVELFIHPIYNLIWLFGDVENVHIQPSLKNDQGRIISIAHKNKVTGVMHLSTGHSWKTPVDEMMVNTQSAVLDAAYPNLLTATKKSPVFFNIPIEKISKRPVTKQILLDNNNFVPTVPNNTIAAQGFLGEIEFFLKMTESNELQARHHLQSLVPVYSIIERFKQR